MNTYKFLGIILFIFFVKTIYSQPNFKPGFIVTTQNDTIKGMIDYRSDEILNRRCTYKYNSFKINYSPTEIVAYGFENGRQFQSSMYRGKHFFLETIITGELSIYSLIHEKELYYFFKKKNGSIVLMYCTNKQDYINNDKYIPDMNTTDIHSYNNEMFFNRNYTPDDDIHKLNTLKTILLDSLYDTPSLKEEINKIKRPDDNNLINLAKKYHFLKTNNGDYLVYKPQKKSSFEFEIRLVSFNLNESTLSDRWIMYSFKNDIPLANENFCISMGFQYAATNDSKLFRFPNQIKYQYQNKNIKPSLGVGLNLTYIYNTNLYRSVNFFPMLETGIAIRIYKQIHLTYDFTSELNLNFPTYLNSEKIFSLSNSIGIMIKR